jgi:hypothetical protein
VEIKGMLDINTIEDTDVNIVVTAMDDLVKNNSGLLSNGNVHGYTRALGVVCREVCLRLDDKYKISDPANKDFENTCQQILALAGAMGESQAIVDIITRVLNTIRSSNNTIEPETGLNVRDLLVRAWSVANNLLVAPEEKNVIIINITDNILTNGGCLAGISGRLAHIYCSNIRTILEKGKQENSEEERSHKRRRTEEPVIFSGTVSSSIPSTKEEENVHLALALSVSAVSNPKSPKQF